MCVAEKVVDQPYTVLGLDLPPPPLFQDERKQNMIPQVPLFELLNKFDGASEHEYKTYKVSNIWDMFYEGRW